MPKAFRPSTIKLQVSAKIPQMNDIGSYLYTPLMLHIPIVYILNPPLHPRRHIPRLLVGLQPTLHIPPPPIDFPHGTYYRRCPSPKRLHQPPLIRRLRQLPYPVVLLLNQPPLPLPQLLPRQLQHALPHHPLQDRPVQRRRPEHFPPRPLLPHADEEIHRPHLRHNLLFPEQPEVLVVPALRGFELRDNAGGVVRAELAVANTAGPCAHGVGGGGEGNGFETRRVVRSDGGGDQVQEGGAGGSDAEGALGANQGGAEVEGVASRAGDESLLQPHELGY